jgi:hypothetical protein
MDFLSQFDRNFHAPNESFIQTCQRALNSEPHSKNWIITPKFSLISSFTPNKWTIFKQRLKPYRKFWKFSIEKDNQLKQSEKHYKISLANCIFWVVFGTISVKKRVKGVYHMYLNIFQSFIFYQVPRIRRKTVFCVSLKVAFKQIATYNTQEAKWWTQRWRWWSFQKFSSQKWLNWIKGCLGHVWNMCSNRKL